MSLLELGRLDTITLNNVEHKVRYVHFRHLVDGKIHSKGGVTLAFLSREDGSIIAKGEHIVLGESFNKKLGRIIATGRLLKQLGLPRK
jgi:hypothetical protein